MVILAAVSDLHTNSTIALSPPKIHLDDGGTYLPSKLQRWINARWADYWQRVDELKTEHQAQVVTIINGELADNNRHPTTQLVSRNPKDLAGAALSVLKVVREVSDEIIVTRGTAAHVGASSNLDEGLARRRLAWCAWVGCVECLSLASPGSTRGTCLWSGKRTDLRFANRESALCRSVTPRPIYLEGAALPSLIFNR